MGRHTLVHNAYEVHVHRRPANIVLTCEHASERLPAGWTWPEADRRLLGTHWSSDLGIASVTRGLAQMLGGVAVLARFSRLLVDANRDSEGVAPSGENLFRAEAEGLPVELNRDLDPADRERRLALWHAYHGAIDAQIPLSAPQAVVLSMHSFTPVFEDEVREMEIGVLYDQEDDIAEALGIAIAMAGWKVALNEPYSGKDGLIDSASRHAGKHGRRALELEIRQDIATDLEVRRRLLTDLAQALKETGVVG